MTTPRAACTTIDTHHAIFAEAGLATAWPRVIAVVVQPGVEFDHRRVVGYDSAKARALSQMIEQCEGLVFEAHSTDDLDAGPLAALVRDHFAILKVGPALTFALREALWALDAIEREWINPALISGFRNIVVGRMKADPRHWSKYYHAGGGQLDYDLQYSLSDRMRYYWPDPEIVHAQERMFRNLTQKPPPDALLSQYLPIAHLALRDGLIRNSPAELAMAHVCAVLDAYHAATFSESTCATRGGPRVPDLRSAGPSPTSLVRDTKLLVSRASEVRALGPNATRPGTQGLHDGWLGLSPPSHDLAETQRRGCPAQGRHGGGEDD